MSGSAHARAHHGGDEADRHFPPPMSRMRARRVRRFARQQPENRARDLDRLRAALERHGAAQAIDAPGLAAAGVDLRVGEPRPHGVDADAFGGDLAREPDRERVDRALRRRVIDVLARRSEPRRDRRDVDDDAARPAVAGGHPPHGLARAQHRAHDVHGEHPRDPLGGHHLQPHLRLDDAGVVDEGGDAAEPRVDLVEEAEDVGFRRDVRAHGDRAPARARDLGDHGVRGTRDRARS